MNFIKMLSNAHIEACNAEEKGLLNWGFYDMISSRLLEAMELWKDNFDYDLESEQDLEDVLKYINSKNRKEVKNERS